MFLRIVVELIERAIARLVGGNLEGVEPFAVDGAVEIFLRSRRGIDILQIDAGARWRGGFRGGFGLGGVGCFGRSGGKRKRGGGQEASAPRAGPATRCGGEALRR